MKFFAQTEAELNAAQSDGETDVLVSIEAMREWIDITRQLAEQRAELLVALKKINAIPNKDIGGDWEEIEEARDIATAAIAKCEAAK